MMTIRTFWLPSLFAMTAFATGSVAAVTQSAVDNDPYLWLEDVTGAKALEWVKEQNAASIKELETRPEFKPIYERLLAIGNSSERIPTVTKLGKHFDNFWRDEKNPKGLWRRTTFDEFRKPQPKWDVILDVDGLAKAEGENWVRGGAMCLPRVEERCLLRFSRGGGDAMVVREFDLHERAFVQDGFELPAFKSRIAWRDRDTLLVATDFGPGSLTESGHPRVLKAWKRGTPLSEAKVIFEADPKDVFVEASRTIRPGYEREYVKRAITLFTEETYILQGDEPLRIEIPLDAQLQQYDQWFLVELRTDWQIGNKRHAGGSLLAIEMDAFLEGKRDFHVLFQPAERSRLDSTFATRDHFILGELDNLRNRYYLMDHENGQWQRTPLPVPEIGNVSLSPIDSIESNEYFMLVADFLTPSSLYYGRIGSDKLELLKQLPAFFDAANLQVQQREAISADGTRIPYFQVSRRDMKLDGNNATLLHGYGGFEVSQLPRYNPSVGAAWLERGGVFVLANIRGGGEFGPAWHRAALRENRQRAYDDFIAIGEDLVKRKVTSPQRLGVMGASNGGLLAGVMLTQRPDLFGAVVSQVPLLDMYRYHKLLAGASWVSEYGNPENPQDWAFMSKYSPYQNIRKDMKYPRALFTTSTRDDRVHPAHARKMVARLKEHGHEALYYENMEGGHGLAADNKQRAYMDAIAYTYLSQQLGL